MGHFSWPSAIALPQRGFHRTRRVSMLHFRKVDLPYSNARVHFLRWRSAAGRNPTSLKRLRRRSADRGGVAADFSATNSGEHRETGQLRNSIDAFGAGSGIDCRRARNRRGPGVDQVGVRALFERLRRMPGGEDRQLYGTADGAYSEGNGNHQRLRGSEGYGCCERKTHGAGDRALRFAQ